MAQKSKTPHNIMLTFLEKAKREVYPKDPKNLFTPNAEGILTSATGVCLGKQFWKGKEPLEVLLTPEQFGWFAYVCVRGGRLDLFHKMTIKKVRANKKMIDLTNEGEFHETNVP